MPITLQPVGSAESPAPPPAPRPPMPPVYGYSLPAAPRPPVGLAVASMICGIISLVSCPMCFFPMGLVGLLLGTVGVMLGVISQIKRRGGTGMAAAGVVTGAIGALLSLVMMTITGFAMLSGSKAVPPAPIPTAGVTTGVPQTTASDTEYDPASGLAPTVMTGEQVVDALIGPLDLPPDPNQAQRELATAIRLYPLRGPGEPRFQEEAYMLSQCVLSFRRHLARAGLAAPADPEHAKLFRTACDELVDRVLEAYRRAGQFEQDDKWDQAQKAYGDMMKHLSDAGTSLARNVHNHVAWCQWKRTDNEGNDPEPPTGQGGS